MNKRRGRAVRLPVLFLLWPAFLPPGQSSSFLEPPPAVKPLLKGNWPIAGRSPAVDLFRLPLDPIQVSAPPSGETPRRWTVWGQGTMDPETGLVYGAVGDHAGRDARIHMIVFDPRTKKISLSPEINVFLGARPGAFADGKIHGRLDFYGGPWLWFCTYWAKYPEPAAEDYATGYRGGHIGRYNVRTGEIADEGVPLPRVSWPSHVVDARRGRLYAAGHFGEFLAWDMKSKKVLFAGRPAPDRTWGNRVLLLDEKSGFVYSSNTSGSDPSCRLLRYDPAANRIEIRPLPMPPDEKGERGPIRAHTSRRGPDGLFRGVTQNGILFAFDPDKETLTPCGACWPGRRRYTTAMASSPGGRYLYYLPGAHGDSHLEGAPIVQYDVRLNRFKVLAFLGPSLLSKYGYLVGGTYSVVADQGGGTLYILMNGVFHDPASAEPLPEQAFGDPVLLVVSIPEEERREGTES